MKRYINTIFFTLVPFVLGFFMCYLIGSFTFVSFDPEMWTFEGRSMTALFGVFWGAALYVKLTFEGLL